MFYPMETSPRNRGDRELPRRGAGAVMDEAGGNPARGARALRVRSTRLAWGTPDRATGGTDPLTGVGDLWKAQGPRKAQPREAREGLPDIPDGDGARPRTSHAGG
jgi:hypothetical protein